MIICLYLIFCGWFAPKAKNTRSNKYAIRLAYIDSRFGL